MATLTLHSNRLYKKALTPDLVDFSTNTTNEYNAVKMTAYSEIVKQARIAAASPKPKMPVKSTQTVDIDKQSQLSDSVI